MVEETENEQAEDEAVQESTESTEEIQNDTPTELELLTMERDKLKDQLLRTAADFDNFRKRTRRDIENTAHRTREDLLRDLLPVIDNLERASHATKNASEVDAVAEGVNMVLRGFEETASRLKLQRMDVVGQRFDPAAHDAMQQQETDEHAAGTIIAEIMPGYMLGERLLRPAMVVVARPVPHEVSKAPSEAPTPTTDSETPQGEEGAQNDENDSTDDSS